MIRRIVQVALAVLVGAGLCTGVASAAPTAPVVPVVPGISLPTLPTLPTLPGLPSLTGGSQISVGPIALPGVSVKVCVNDTCRTAAGVTSLTVTLKGSATLLGTPPLLLPVACTSGTGLGVKTAPGSLGAVSGSVELATSNGAVTVPISQSVGTTKSLTVSACTTTTVATTTS
jgi:hypothetical protein